MSGRARTGYAGRLLTFIATVTLVLWLGTTSAAHAARPGPHEPMRDVEETGQPGLLGLTSSVLPLQIPWLEPGDSFSWQIGLRLTEQPVADGTLDFIPYGGLTQQRAGYRLVAKRCETQWTGQSGTNAELECPSGEVTLLADALLETGPAARIPIGSVAASTSPHILFTLSLPDQGASAGPFTFALGFTVIGDETMRNNSLPDTGFAAVGVLIAAVALLAAGLFARLAGRRTGKS